MTNNPASESNPAQPPAQALGFRALKLRVGLALQAQSLVAGARKEEVQFLAAVDFKGIMLGPYRSGETITLTCGSEYTIQGFTGQYDFSFNAKVIQTFDKPFAYALLAYPDIVSARLVRRAMRMKTSFPARVTPADQSQPVGVTLVDVSHCGAMVHSPVPLGVFGDVLNLALSIDFEGDLVSLNIPSTICHSRKSDHDDGTNFGLTFKPNSKSDKLMLYFLAQSSNDA